MATVSAIFGCRLAVAPPSGRTAPTSSRSPMPSPAPTPALIECSSRPNKKATAHHMKSRPKKTQPWDIKRKPTVYPPLPDLPPDWTLVSREEEPPAEASDSAIAPITADAPPAS